MTYSAGPDRDFAVFVPPTDEPAVGDPALEPTIAIEADGTQILGNTTVHGNLVLDGTSLQFPARSRRDNRRDTGGHPAMYRIKAAGGDELRIDVGSLNDGDRTLVLGVTKDGQFNPALEVSFPGRAAARPARWCASSATSASRAPSPATTSARARSPRKWRRC